MTSLGIDIGGANLKIAAETGYEIIYFPMWERAKELSKTLSQIAKRCGAERAGVVTTAELADAFSSKNEGINHVVDACKKVFKKVYFLTLDGELVSDVKNPLHIAASNWVASVSFLIAEGFRNFLFVDMGSTTVDLIPVTDSIKAGKTDYERLKRGELLYFGLLRTPVFYLLREFDGVPLCPEYFAITADAFLVTGDIGEEDYSCDTPDGKGRSREECMRRLARTLCCDLEELGEENVEKLAGCIRESLIEKMREAISEKITQHTLHSVIACGIGEQLIEKACSEAGAECLKLSDKYGDFSKLFPAYSMLRLVELRIQELKEK